MGAPVAVVGVLVAIEVPVGVGRDQPAHVANGQKNPAVDGRVRVTRDCFADQAFDGDDEQIQDFMRTFLRNVAVAMGNTRAPRFAAAITLRPSPEPRSTT